MLAYTNRQDSGYAIAERFHDANKATRVLRRAWFAHLGEAEEYMRRKYGDGAAPHMRIIHDATGVMTPWRGLVGPTEAVEKLAGGRTENTITLDEWLTFADTE